MEGIIERRSPTQDDIKPDAGPDNKTDIEQINVNEGTADDRTISDVFLTYDDDLEKKLVRKLDMVIMPLTCALYLLAYLDRSNLGELSIFLLLCSVSDLQKYRKC